ncbi:MAG: CUB domain-containing protein [Deltaproteobacteria bacterium]|jgi:hypothetical protein|nr:CUB domain-containing protein [Deltaproteobacteria bacterium]
MKQLFTTSVILILQLLLFSCTPGNEIPAHDIQTYRMVITEHEVPRLIESEHPYGNYRDLSWNLSAPEAAVRIVIPFTRLETEYYYDRVLIYDKNDNLIHNLTGDHSGESFVVTGNFARIRLLSDYSIDDYGIKIDHYIYITENEEPEDHRPVCRTEGQEGWYWADTGELIKAEACSGASTPVCDAIGSRSEGWYTDSGLITWDFCHQTERISIYGENCGPSIGFECYDGLFCSGVPQNTHGGTGVCIYEGSCRVNRDCTLQFGEPDCQGQWSCQDNTCVEECSEPEEPEMVWSWSTFMVADMESPHPYPNYYSNDWQFSWSDAEKIKLHFSSYDLEYSYDYLTVSDGQYGQSFRLTGAASDYWTNEIEGDSVVVNLASDYSVTAWGFKVDAVSVYHQIPAGTCNIDADCSTGEYCEPAQCFNPYAPCYGTCTPEQSDGQQGASCTDTEMCAEDLFCKNIVDGAGSCQPENWCESSSVETDCALLPHIAIPGNWVCSHNTCTWQAS